MKITTASILTSIVGLIVLLSAAGPALALPFYFSRTETFSGHVEVQQFSGNSPVSTLVNTGTIVIASGIATMAGAAEASPGQLSARGSGGLSVHSPSLTGFAAGTVSEARFILDDIVISGPGLTVPTSLSLHVDGSLGQTVNVVIAGLGFLGAVGGSSSMAISGGFFALTHTPFGGSVIASHQVGNCGPTGCAEINSFVASGLFDGFTGSDMNLNLSTPVFVAQVGAPFTLDMRLAASGSASYGIGGTFFFGSLPDRFFSLSADGSSNFSNTVSFPTAGPVFNLPDGYTANSLSGLIVDNQWTGGPVTAVPVPSSLLLLIASGLAGLIGFGTGKRRIPR